MRSLFENIRLPENNEAHLRKFNFLSTKTAEISTTVNIWTPKEHNKHLEFNFAGTSFLNSPRSVKKCNW